MASRQRRVFDKQKHDYKKAIRVPVPKKGGPHQDKRFKKPKHKKNWDNDK